MKGFSAPEPSEDTPPCPSPDPRRSTSRRLQPLQAVEKQLGVVPNLFRLVGNSPAALAGYLGLNGALAKGALEAPTRERIALAIAEVNGCGYCLSAHSYLGKNLAKLSDAEIVANRDAATRPIRRRTRRLLSPSPSSMRAAMCPTPTSRR